MARCTKDYSASDGAWNSGYTARRFGDPRESNPWLISIHKVEYKAWLSGWTYRDSLPNPGDLA